jgi:hypothetical protein
MTMRLAITLLAFLVGATSGSAQAPPQQPARVVPASCQGFLAVVQSTEALRDICARSSCGDSPATAECLRSKQTCLDTLTKTIADQQEQLNECINDKGDCSQKSSTKQNVETLQAQVKRDQEAIQRLGFGQIGQSVQDWQDLAKDARASFESDALDMLLASIKSANTGIGSLNPPRANAIVSQLRAAGIDSEPLNQAIRSLASTPGKAGKARYLNDVINGISNVKSGITVKQNLGKSDLESQLEVLSTLVGMLETNSELAYLATDLKFTTSSIYNNATRRLNLSDVLRTHVSQLSEAQRRLAALSSCP